MHYHYAITLKNIRWSNSYSIEHEVLPCYEQRVALTIWVSADDSKLPLYPSVASITSGQDLDRQRIFVSLVNYRDSEAPFTVRDLFAKAAHPKRIFIGEKIIAGDS